MRYFFSLLLFLVSMCAMSQSDIKDMAKKNKKDASPSMPMVRRTCTACGGTGIHVWPSGNRDRCMGCDGKGYTLSYF